VSQTSAAEYVSAASALGPLVLEAQELTKDFRIGGGLSSSTLSAVRAVSLTLHRSAVVALVGESGSGKSTLAKLLAGQERATSGAILLDGKRVTPSNRRAFRAYKSDVQMVFQDPFASINPVHKVRYPLERAVRLHQRDHGRAQVAAEVTRLLEEVRLTPAEQYLARYPHELSGGQRQRVAIARALAVQPRVLLADEPVSMLDVSIRLEVLDVIDQLRARFELAVLYITHDIASARYFADETLVMYAGEIVERGPSEDLTQRPAHPYTQLLLAAAPDPDRLGTPVPVRVAGSASRAATSPLSSTVGCRFSPRCRFADERCHAQSPPMHRISPQRTAACWRLDVAAPELATQGDEERSVQLKA
jgi:peptide/nickel transport system ATP-binding protein